MMERVFTDQEIDDNCGLPLLLQGIIQEQREYLSTQYQFSPEQVEELIAGSRNALQKMMRVKP